MATYNNTRNKKIYFIYDGKIHTGKGDAAEEFTGIDGVLKDIALVKVKVKGEERMFTEFQFEDAGEPFSVSCELHSWICISIVRRLVNVKDFSKKILIETWLAEKMVDNVPRTFTNLSIIQDEQRVEWVEIPEVEKFRLDTGEMGKSTKKRDDFIDSLIKDIQARLKPNAVRHEAPSGPAPIDDGPDGAYFGDGVDYQANIVE